MKKSTLLLFTIFFLLKNLSAQVINIDSIITAGMADVHVPGVAAVILKKGIPVWKNSYGYARIDDSIAVTENTSFMLASISKTFISTAVMKEYENGTIDLDKDINAYLPFEIQNPFYPDDIITMRQLLTHTSSLQDNWVVLTLSYTFGMDSPVPLGDYMKDYFTPGGAYYSEAGNFYDQEPGTHYHYCNEGAALAAYILETVVGMSFADYCNQKIFTSLCMDNTSWFLAGLDTFNVAMPYRWKNGEYLPNGYYCYPDYPDGQLRTSLLSLTKFMAMMMNHGTWNNQQILQSSTVDEILSQQIPNIDSTQGIIWYQYDIGGRTCWGHDGGDAGVSTNLYFSIKDSTGIIILSNGNNFYLPGVLDAMFDYAESLEPAPSDSFTCEGFPSAVVTKAQPENMMNVFPNPSDGIFSVESSTTTEHPIQVEVKNQLSETVYSRTIYNGVEKIDLSSFPPGIYFIYTNYTNQLLTRKIIITK